MNEKMILDYIDLAIAARDNAYAPYSKFKVGALVIDELDHKHIGCNVENGSFGLSNCAERTAIFSAISNGMKKIKYIVIVADTSKPVSPCGACRQVISEFADDETVIILANLEKKYKIMCLEDILPYRFEL